MKFHKKISLQNSAIRAILLYVCASLLMAACGEREQLTQTHPRKHSDNQQNQSELDQSMLLNSQNKSGSTYTTLKASEALGGASLLASRMNEQEQKAALELARKFSEVHVLTSDYENFEPGQAFYVDLILADQKEKTASTGDGAKDEQNKDGDKDTKSSKLVPRIKLKKNDENKFDSALEKKIGSPPETYSGDSEYYHVTLVCYKLPNCEAGVLSVTTQPESVDPLKGALYDVTILPVSVSQIAPHMAPDQPWVVVKGKKRILLVAFLENAELLKSVTNTVDYFQQKSFLWMGLAQARLNEEAQSLDVRGELVQSKAQPTVTEESNSEAEGVKLRATGSPDDFTKDFKDAEIRDHRSDGTLRLRLNLQPKQVVLPSTVLGAPPRVEIRSSYIEFTVGESKQTQAKK